MTRFLMVLFAFVLLGAGQASALKLRITLQLPIGSPLGANLVAFQERVAAASGGDIEVEIYPGAQLYTDKEVPIAVASGQIEMGVASLARFAGTIPAVDVFSVPFLFNSDALVRTATAPDSPVRSPLDQAMIAKGARPLWWQPYGLAILMSAGAPIATPADMAGLKIRTFGKAMEAFVNACGGAAVNISGSRQFLAYERGTVDGGTTSLVNVAERKLYQVLEGLNMTHHATIEFVVIINEQVWQSLEGRERQILTAAAREVEEMLRDEWAVLDREAMATVLAEGMTVHELSDDELSQWLAATAGLRDAYVEAAGPLGQQLLDAADSLR